MNQVQDLIDTYPVQVCKEFPGEEADLFQKNVNVSLPEQNIDSQFIRAGVLASYNFCNLGKKN